MGKKLFLLFVIYIVLRTVAPDVAAVVVGIGIASAITLIKMGGEIIAPTIEKLSSQDITNATAAVVFTAIALATLYVWEPLKKRMRKARK